MAKILAGVVAVSIAALLFAGCGDDGPKMSPAQKELQKQTCDQLNAKKKETENRIASWKVTVEEWRAAGRGAAINPSTKDLESELERNLKERAAWGC
jgi:hypothetical protein